MLKEIFKKVRLGEVFQNATSEELARKKHLQLRIQILYSISFVLEAMAMGAEIHTIY